MARESRRRSRDDSRRRRRDRDRDRERERERRSSRDRQSAAQPPNINSFFTFNRKGNKRRDERRRSYSSSSSSSSSVASSLLDISRHYSPTRRYGGVIGTFFRAPSERRRRSRRTTARSSKRPNFYFGGGNSSSSSVNSDLAYGHGYIPRLKGRNSSSRNVAAAAASGRHRSTRDRDSYESASRPGGPARSKTDEEILSIGRQLNDLARDQNKKDLKAGGIAKTSTMAAGAAALYAMHKKGKKRSSSPTSRGIGSSRVHGASSSDESDWESASEDEEDSSDDSDAGFSQLAYGSAVGSNVGPSFGTAAGVLAGAAGAAYVGHELYDRYGRRKSSVVDPALFGPVNSLHGSVTTPCGFDDPRNQQRPTTTNYMGSGTSYDNMPMRDVYPVPTSDPNRFDVDKVSSADLPHRSRPSAVPLQQPVPKLPVSPKVYNADKLEDSSSRRGSRGGRDRSDSHGISASTAAGMTAAALGAAALVSNKKDDKDKDKRRSRDYDDRERERERERERDRDSKRRDKDSDRDGERRKSKRDSHSSSSKYGDDRDHKRHHSRYDDYDDAPRKRREVDAAEYPDQSSKSRSKKDRRDKDKDYDRDTRSEVSRSSRRSSDKYSTKRDDPYEESKKSKAGDRDSKETPKSILSSSKIDPFQFQVSDDAFAIPPISKGSARPLTPNIVTIDHEPEFSDADELLPLPESRLSRKDSFEIEQMVEDQISGSRDISRKDPRSGHDYEEGEHAASSIYDEAKHATIPVAAGAIAAAVAIEGQRSRERRRDQYDDYGSRERAAGKRDTVQEEADRYYRESVIARKIEEEQKHENATERSVVTKWDDSDGNEPIAIVTPPEMQDTLKNVGPYDAPNADVRIDNHIYPEEEDQFRPKSGKKKKRKSKEYKSRDPSCERDRPLLNLVLPTPLSSREATPAVEEQISKQAGSSKETSRDIGSVPDVVLGPKGEVMQNTAANKSVTWGQNSTKSFVVESPDPESRSDVEVEVPETAVTVGSKDGSPPGSKDKTRSRLAKTSQWGILASAIAGSSNEPDNEPETASPKSSKKSKKSKSSGNDADFSAMGPDQVFSVDTRDQPPVPGPKPASPSNVKMPGSFADDIEFAATLAAGLKDTGFDSNIVIDDPTYRRRDSPPGSKEANGDDWRHQTSFSDIVTDATSKNAYERSVASEPGSKSRDLESPRDKTVPDDDEWTESSKKLTKKEKKKLEKLRRQSTDSVEPSETASPDSISFEDAVENLPKLSKKEQKKRDKEARARALQLETEELSNVQQQREPEDNDTPTAREASEDIWEDTSSKKKKKKNRKSRDLEEDRVTVPADAFDDLQSLRKSDKDEDDWETPSKSKRKSMTDFEALAKGATGSEISETPSKKSSKSKRRSLNEETLRQYNDDEPPSDRRRDFFDDREVTSVVSESRGDDRRRDSRSKRSSRLIDDDDAKSIVSAPGGSRKSRDKDKDSSKRSSGLFASIFKGKDDDKKDSFLDNAGTLGAGVGLAGAAAVVASSISRSNAANSSSKSDRDEFPRVSDYEALDPEIAARAIRPAIDPQYGDLLPLPPSEPGSPRQGPKDDDLPTLPDSRPDTPPEERSLKREQLTHRRRRSTQDAHTKSPSNTAIPISLRLGQRSSPVSPGNNSASMRSPPMSSPSPTTTPEAVVKRLARGTSWDSSREIKPLYLLEHSRHGSNEAVIKQEDLPELPPSESSEPPSREDPAPDYDLSLQELATTGLHIQTDEVLSKSHDNLAGSQETTPKAESKPELPALPTLDAPVQGKEPSDAIDAETTRDEDPAEWAGLTAKQKKKLKKARKSGTALEFLIPATETCETPATEEVQPTSEALPNEETAATVDDFETPKKGKKSKKDKKRQSFDPWNEEPPAADATEPKPEDTVAVEIQSGDAAASKDQEPETGDAQSEDTWALPLSKKDKKKKKKQLELQRQVADEVPADAPASDERVEDKTGEFAVDGHERSKNPDGPTSLEQHVSEPLFSQEAPLVETQDGVTSVEPTQQEEATAPDSAADEWAEIPSKKSKKDKKKKKSQSNVWDLIEGASADPATAERPADEAQQATKEGDSLSTALDRGLTEEPATVDANSVQAEDEWSTPSTGKKSKKDKKKKRESVTFTDEPHVVEPVEPEVGITAEPAEEELASKAVAPTEAVGETRETTAEPADVDEWPVKLSKKDKKKKKRQSLLSNPETDEPAAPETVQDAAVAPEDDESKAAEPSRDDIVVEVEPEPETANDATKDLESAADPGPAAEDSWGFGLSKKEKKKLKKKGLLVDEAPAPSVDQPSTSEAQEADAPVEDIEPAAEKVQDDLAAEDSFGFGLSKKEKKKLKKKGLLADDVVDVQEEASPAAVADDAEPTTEKVQDDLAAEDSFGFGLSKKEKKKLKKKGLLADDGDIQEEPTAPVEETEPAPEKAQDDLVAEDSFGFGLSKKEKKKLMKKGLLPADSATAPSTDRDIVTDVKDDDIPAAAEATPTEPAETTQGDVAGDESWGFGLSKKEKKKLKKKGLLVDDADEVKEDAAPVPQDDSLPAAAEDPEATTEAVDVESTEKPQDDPAADDSWGFGLSKKEKKKLKKKGLLPDESAAAPSTEADAIADVKDNDIPAAVDAGPADATQGDMDADDSWGFGLSKKEKKKLKKKGLLPDESAATPSTEPEVVTEIKDEHVPAVDAEPAENVGADESWAFGLSKKEMKKLKKKGLLPDDSAAAPSTEPDVVTEVKDEAPAAAEVEPADAKEGDMDADESWAFGLSKKEMKKLKKKGLLPDDSTAAPSTEPDAVTDVKDDTTAAVDAEPAETSQADVGTEDSWGFGLSKKDKKKLKKQGLTVAAIAGAAGLALNTTDNEPESESVESDAAKDNIRSTSASPTPKSPAAAPEDDDPFPITMSKKDKKKAKKLAKVAKDSLDDQGDEPAVAESPREELPSTPLSSSWADEMDELDATTADQTLDKPISEKEQDPANADDFGFETSSSKKKSKKDKKKRKSGLQTFELPGEDVPAEAPGSNEPQRDLELTTDAVPEQPEAGADQHAPPAELDVQTAEVDLDDEWAVPVKKGKKGKKSKRSSIADTPAPEQEPEPIAKDLNPSTQLDTTDPVVEDKAIEPGQQESTEAPTPEPVVDDFWPTVSKKKKDKKGKKKSLSLADDSWPSSPAPVEGESAETGRGLEDVTAPESGNAFDDPVAAAEPIEATADDEWNTQPSKKKSKKDKKRKSTQDKLEPDADAEASREVSGTAEKQTAPRDLWDDEDFFVPKSKSPVDDFMQERSRETISAKPVITETPAALTSMEDVVMHAMDKHAAVEGDLSTTSMGDIVQQAMSKDVPAQDKPSSSMGDIVGQVMDKKSVADEEPVAWETTKKKSKKNRKSLSEDAEASGENAAAAAALTGDVAMLTEKFGGSKKGKKSKAKKIVDKRTSGGDDIFDDPALWESADKKNVTEGANADADDDGFWQATRGNEDDAARESAMEMPAGLLRQDSNTREPGHLLQEQPWPAPSSELSEQRSSPTRGLPAVQEIPEAEADPNNSSNWPTPELNQDSGFMAASPRLEKDGTAHRDYGVDGDGGGRHEPSTERRLRHSPSGTPVLKEPVSSTRAMEDPEKRIGPSSKNYGNLAAVATALSKQGGSKAGYDSDEHGRRSVSDSMYSPNKASFSERDPQGRADAVSGNGSGSVAGVRRSASNSSLSRQRTPEPLKFRPDSPGIRNSATPTPPLRRVDKRLSGDLRALRQQNNSTPPVANEGRVRSKDMADVYDGYGEGRMGSPKSPTRPHSMRRRQSMQVLELESKVEQLMAENKMLSEGRSSEDRGGRSVSVLSERDAEIDTLKQSIQYLQQEVSRLTEVNEGLTSANAELANKDGGRLGGIYMHSGDGTRGFDGGAASPSFQQSLEEKDAEIADLRSQLEAAKEQVRDMQRKILESKAGEAEFLDVQDEDYFDTRCQQLCSHVQQWVLRFSKFSDMRACRLTSEINDEKTIDRLDNAVLDGSDVDTYLNDRVKRRDVFMSMTMNMIWEFVFTRYLFGMDREQRQKLKSLEKLLNDVGPAQAVRQWRAVTLTLLSRRESFKEQRDQDTEAVVQAIFQTLCKILPPPGNLETQIQSQLRRVMNEAVDLAIEMRKQKAEYMMLPPLQPEYDADGELAATVQFNASMMNERSAQNTTSNEDLETQGSIVRVVLFPLVVKKGDDEGVGDEEIVVCPAQVVIAREHQRRHLTPGSDGGGASLGAPSRLSVVTEPMSAAPDSQYME